MKFDYSTTGLPANKNWETATNMCREWFDTSEMGQRMLAQFKEAGVIRFMHAQPIAAAKRLLEFCPDAGEEAVTLLLAGPAKGNLAANDVLTRAAFGDRTVDLLNALAGRAPAVDAQMQRDINRMSLLEAISAMNDQIIDRHLFKGEKSRFEHHPVRKNMLRDFEALHAQTKGENPKLDAVFEDALAQSRVAMDAIDKELAAKKTPKPPGM